MGIFRKKNGKKTIAIFVISTLESAEMQKIAKKKKKIKFGTKIALSILGCKFEKVMSYFKSASSNLEKIKIKNYKILNFGTKNA